MENNPDIQLLLKKLSEGSEWAFDKLYKKYSGRVFSFALSLLKDRSEAEEIVQEVFLKVWDKRFVVSSQGSFQSFLFTISKNTILNSIRKTDYHRAFIEYKKYNPEPAPKLDEELNSRELHDIYQQAIEKLSPRKKQIFILNQNYDLTHHEIASKLGISPKTVRNQIDTASAEIKSLISSVGFTGMLIFFFFVK